MARPNDVGETDRSGAISYKVVAGIALSALFGLAGATWGIISAYRADEVAANRAVNIEQWHSLKQLSDDLIDHKAEHRVESNYLKRTLDEVKTEHKDLETRLRGLEHKSR